MPIIKKFQFDKTTILTNEFLQNKEISLEAKGLLGYMLSLPNDWDFTISGIASQTNTSEYKIIKILKELEVNGYHTKKHIYENGRIKDWVYYIFAEPQQSIIDGIFDNNIYEQDVKNQESCFSGDKQSTFNKLNVQNNKTKNNNIDNSELENSNNDLARKDILTESIEYIIDYLNKTAGTKYKPTTKGTITLIKARFNEGYTIDDFYDVIDNKWKEWKNTEFEKYIRPETLFGNKFENYLNGKVFEGKAKISYGKPTFDNTADHIVPKGISDMTEEERNDFIQNELARDENGNLIIF